MIDSGNTLLILRKWAEDEVLLLFRFESTEAACAIVGILSEDKTSVWQVRSRLGDATFSFGLGGGTSEYVERRASSGDVPDDVAEKGNLLIFFSPRFSSDGIPERRGSLTISELLPSELVEKN